MPTTTGDRRFFRWVAGLIIGGLAGMLLGRLIDPRTKD